MADTFTVMGFDYGKTRIGIAIMNTLTGIPTPQSTITARDGAPDWTAISRCLNEWKPARLVVGMPRKLDGSDSAMQEPIERFIRQLAGRYNLPVDVVSEQLSSREAEQRLKQARQAGRKRKIRKDEIDQVAATIILESWMQEYAHVES